MDLPTLILQLQRITFPPETGDSAHQKYQFYFMRILNSRVSHTVLDDDSLQTEITRIQTAWPKQKSLRFQELLTRLTRQKQLKHRNAVLQHLLKLSHLKETRVDSLFRSSKEVVAPQQGSSLSHMKKSLMEIESGLTATLQHEPPRQRAPENNLAKTIKNVTDKGNQQIQLKEFDLVCDCLYAIQGIEAHYIVYDAAVDGFALRKDVAVSLPTRKLVNQLCEIGWLYNKIANYLREQSQVEYSVLSKSLIQQALQNGLREEMNEYYRLIAILENMLQQDQQAVRNDAVPSLSLRKLFLWIRNPQIHFTNLGVLISSISHPQQLQGQAPPPAVIISTLYALSLHGCQTAHALYNRLLAFTCVPLVRFINQWVFEGRLDNAEFFVEREERINMRDAGELWKREFAIQPDRVPSIIRREDAQLIFDTGRVVNWVHRQCQFKNWHIELPPATVEQLLQNGQQEAPLISTIQSFNTWITQANTKANLKLIELIFKHFHFNTHLQAIKRYLLLGQGEFIHTLMETVQEQLSKPASTIYKHNLIGLLESAIRASNVQFLPQEIQTRLDVKLLEAAQGDTGWEIFSLDYKLDEPLNTILNQKAMLNYLRIFNFLWRVKRVEFTIAQIWKLHVKSQRLTKQSKYLRRAYLVSHSIRNEMQHFIANFYNYVMLEAVETAWTKFNDELLKAKDLAQVIQLHEQFQSDVLDRAFMTQKNEGIYRQLLKVFDLIFRFKFIQEVLIKSDAEPDRIIDEVQSSMRQHSNLSQKSLLQSPQQVQEQYKLLLELHKEYKSCISELQDRLKKDEKLKFLSFRLDFNEYYYKLNNEVHFNVDLDKFVGMYIQNPNLDASRRQSQQPQQQTQIKKLTSSVQSIKSNILPPQKPLVQNLVQPVFPQSQLPSSGQIRSDTSLQMGLKLLEEQRKTNQQYVLQAKQKLQQRIDEEAPPVQGINVFRVSKEEHERMKNDEDDEEEEQLQDSSYELHDDDDEDDV